MNAKISVRTLLTHGYTPTSEQAANTHQLVELRTVEGITADALLCLLPYTSLHGRQVHLIAAKFSVFCARKMLPYFEREHPHDDRARQLLRVAELWLTDGTPVSPFALIWCSKWRPVQEAGEAWSLPCNAMQAILDTAVCCGAINSRAACARARSVLWLSSWRTPTGWAKEDAEYLEYLRSLL